MKLIANLCKCRRVMPISRFSIFFQGWALELKTFYDSSSVLFSFLIEIAKEKKMCWQENCETSKRLVKNEFYDFSWHSATSLFVSLPRPSANHCLYGLAFNVNTTAFQLVSRSAFFSPPLHQTDAGGEFLMTLYGKAIFTIRSRFRLLGPMR